MDLRGFGGSDKPPRGYDTTTSAADVAGVIRSLGASDAVVVGHDLGGWIAWAMPALTPSTVRAVAVLSSPHPLETYRAYRHPRHLAGLRHVLGFQVPMRPERRLRQPAQVEHLLESWACPGWPGEEERRRYSEAMRIPFVAHSAMEYYRWGVRSIPRPDGRRFVGAVRRAIEVPVLQVNGSADRVSPAREAAASSAWVSAPYRFELLDGVGHFPAEEAPDDVNKLLLAWLAGL
jgi:pimeloyl-ACP methyl ester carboxylesterase